jgi:dirigent-like protein
MARVLVPGFLVACLLTLATQAEATRSGVMTIRLLSRVSSSRVVDRAPKHAWNKGDVVYIRSALRNQVAQFGKPKGALVGHDYAVDTFLSATRAKVTVQVTLPGGTLIVRGQVSQATSGGVLPVVGGTGRFAHARGTCSVRDRNRYSINVYRLQLP